MVRSTHHHVKKRMRDFNRFPQNASRLVDNAPQRLLGISDNQLGGMFENAWQLFAVGEYPTAVRAFTILCFVQPYVADFWFGLGKALRENLLSEDALSAFFMAETLDPSTFEYYEESIRCCLELKQTKEALRVFRRLCAKKKSIEHFAEYAHTLRTLKKQIAGTGTM